MKEYYSQRAGKTPSAITIDDLASIIRIAFKRFVTKGYFLYSFGKIDKSGYSDPYYSQKLFEELTIIFGSRDGEILQCLGSSMRVNRNSLFDLIEFLADRVAKIKPNVRYPNDDYVPTQSEISVDEGREEWCAEINQHLTRLDPPYRLNVLCQIESLPPEGLQDLVDNCANPSQGDGMNDTIKHACRMFLKHNSTREDKRMSLTALVGILEQVREDVKKCIQHDDEQNLFNIANNYSIRHNNIKQKTDYGDEYFHWVFYYFLATIDLVGKLKLRHL